MNTTNFPGLGRRWWIFLSVVMLTLGSSVRVPAYELPDLSSPEDSVMTPVEQVQLGKAFMRSVRQSLNVMDDPLINRYLESLGDTLVSAAGESPDSFDFFVVDQPVVNAFAGPGRHIGVFSGLILTTETESELAAVLSHEIGHEVQNHLMRMLAQRKRTTLPATALMIAAAILGSQISSDASMAAIAGVTAAAAQGQINFTRNNEEEADRVGITILVKAGFDPYAMAGFFGRLERATGVARSMAPAFLRTHPVTSDRIAEALDRASVFGVRQRPDSLGFQLTRAALRVRSYRRPEQALDFFKRTLNQRDRMELADRYGYALALLADHQLAAAKKQSAQLLAQRPMQDEFLILDARIDQELGHHEQAIDHLRQALGLSVGDWPLQVAYGQALLEAGQPGKALHALESVARARPGNAMIYGLLEQAALRAGDHPATFRYRAEKLYAQGDVEAAIRQLEIALRQSNIPYHDAAAIQARMKEWQEEQEDADDKGWKKRL